MRGSVNFTISGAAGWWLEKKIILNSPFYIGPHLQTYRYYRHPNPLVDIDKSSAGNISTLHLFLEELLQSDLSIGKREIVNSLLLHLTPILLLSQQCKGRCRYRNPLIPADFNLLTQVFYRILSYNV